jgi:hypothetical protein
MTKLTSLAPLAWGVLLGLFATSTLAFKVFGDKPNCVVSLDKQKVLYIGVDNPLTMVVRGVPADQVVIKTEGLSLKVDSTGLDHYIARASEPGMATITVSGGDLEPVSFQYRVKRIPDPVVVLSGNKKLHRTSLSSMACPVQPGLAAVLENFDFDAQCDVVSYEVTYLPKRQDPITMTNAGGRFNSDISAWICKAKPGDAYFFDDIRVLCPGDIIPRRLAPLAFRIR